MEKRRTDQGETPHGRVLSDRAEEDGLGMRLPESAAVAHDVVLRSSALLAAPSPAESEPPRDPGGTSGRGTMPGPQGMRHASHAMECAEDIETDKNSEFWCSADMLAATSIGSPLAAYCTVWIRRVKAPALGRMSELIGSRGEYTAEARPKDCQMANASSASSWWAVTKRRVNLW